RDFRGRRAAAHSHRSRRDWTTWMPESNGCSKTWTNVQRLRSRYRRRSWKGGCWRGGLRRIPAFRLCPEAVAQRVSAPIADKRLRKRNEARTLSTRALPRGVCVVPPDRGVSSDQDRIVICLRLGNNNTVKWIGSPSSGQRFPGDRSKRKAAKADSK